MLIVNSFHEVVQSTKLLREKSRKKVDCRNKVVSRDTTILFSSPHLSTILGKTSMKTIILLSSIQVYFSHLPNVD